MTRDEHDRDARPPGRRALDNMQALLELCDAQQASIDRLQQALEDHDRTLADRHSLKQMLAHELRTPLAAIIGTLHTLAIPDLTPEKQADLRGRALRQSEHLNEMIDDILAMADPQETSVARTPQEWVGLGDLLADVAEQVSAEVEPGRLVVDAPPDTSIRTVPGRVRQILVNLVVNAARYSPPGSPITLTATRLSDRAVFEVTDEGPGISPETVEALFQAFRRGESSDNSDPGVGLGLYLVRNLVRSLAGAVHLIARDDGGTVARVDLPQKRVEDRTPKSKRHLRVVGDAD